MSLTEARFHQLIDAAQRAVEDAFDASELDKIARSLKNLSQAMHLEQDFAKRIREEARREAQAQIRDKIKDLGSAAELKELSDEELAKKLAELATETNLA